MIGLAGGINVLVAHSLGAKNPKDTKEIVHTSACVSACAGVFFALIGVIFASNILELMNTKSELIDSAVLYFRIYVLYYGIVLRFFGVYGCGNCSFPRAWKNGCDDFSCDYGILCV